MKALSENARRVATQEKETLDRLKAKHARLERADFLWHHLLQSFATMGRAAGWKSLVADTVSLAALSYETFAALASEARLAHAELVCRRVKIRMPARKAEYIIKSFDHIEALGGPAAAHAALFGAAGRDAKIAFLKGFPGIGDKYARQIMMDVHHEEFRDSFVIDARIVDIGRRHGIAEGSYAQTETAWLAVANDAGLTGWELNRVLLYFPDYFKAATALS